MSLCTPKTFLSCLGLLNPTINFPQRKIVLKKEFLSQRIKNNGLFVSKGNVIVPTKGMKLHCLSVMKYKKLKITRDGSKNFCAKEK